MKGSSRFVDCGGGSCARPVSTFLRPGGSHDSDTGVVPLQGVPFYITLVKVVKIFFLTKFFGGCKVQSAFGKVFEPSLF